MPSAELIAKTKVVPRTPPRGMSDLSRMLAAMSPQLTPMTLDKNEDAQLMLLRQLQEVGSNPDEGVFGMPTPPKPASDAPLSSRTLQLAARNRLESGLTKVCCFLNI